MTKGKPIKLLLVEDNPTDVLTLKEYLGQLRTLELDVHHVERLSGAVSFVREQGCDVILLDLGLPDSQGLETLTRVRAQSLGIPLLVLTGTDDEATGVKALQAGAQDFLIKSQIQAPLLGKAIRYALERSQMQHAMMCSEKLQALGTLAGGIAHDFNNILLTVSGNARLALEHLPENHAAYTNVLEIAKAGGRAVALTKKILTFGQQQEARRQPTQLLPLVEESLSVIRPAMPPEIEIRKNVPANLPAILADAGQVHQLLANLITNAADAIGKAAGSIEISANAVHLNGNGVTLSAKLQPGDYVKLAVKDTGPGIDRQTLGRIFEPFYTTKPQGRGTGMGLAIVHGIMKNHQGEVSVYSEVGKGTVFNLYFPASQEDSTEPYSAVAPLPHGHGQHILYVDDEEPLVLLVTRTLMRLGYHVSGFTDPLEALRVLRQNPCNFQATVSDLSMPQMSGIDLAHEVLRLCPNMPVIITTGYILPQDTEQAKRAGVREVILKPDTVEELANALHRLIG